MIKNLGLYILILLILCFCPTSKAENQCDPHSLQDSYAKVAEKAFPAVVVILNCQYNRRGELCHIANGSGFFVRNDGVLVTNYHVIEGADVLGVRLLDGKLLPASVIGTSKATDIAVLKVAVEGKVPFLQFADTSKVKVGHYTIAIGAPLSLSHTMTTGIISFKGRKLGVNNYEDFIQTDASINPGNSGGPLLNIDGLVIGVNDCAIMPRGTGSIGLNFAIDAKLVQRILGTLLNKGLKERPRIGMTVEELPKGVKGVKVTAVFKKSAAEAAGIKDGDVIIAIDNTTIQDIFHFQAFVLTNFSAGDSTTLEVIRDGKRQKLNLILR